jgi:hypothetical protein
LHHSVIYCFACTWRILAPEALTCCCLNFNSKNCRHFSDPNILRTDLRFSWIIRQTLYSCNEISKRYTFKAEEWWLFADAKGFQKPC